MKQLLLFVAGVITGVVGVTLYEIFGKPTLPTPDMDDTQPVKVR